MTSFYFIIAALKEFDFIKRTAIFPVSAGWNIII